LILPENLAKGGLGTEPVNSENQHARSIDLRCNNSGETGNVCEAGCELPL